MPKLLTPEEVQFYKDNGYIKINVLDKAELEELSEEYDLIFRLQANDDMDPTWVGKDMEKAAKNKQVRAHIKPPENGAPYLMHQDYPYFPYKNHSMCAVFLHMDDTTPENGGLCVYPGSHKLGPITPHVELKNGFNYYWCDPEKYPIDGATPVHAKKGEIVIFSYLLLHGSYLNLSKRMRRMFLVQVMDADDEPAEDKHHSPAQGLMLRGIKSKLDKETSTYKKNAAH